MFLPDAMLASMFMGMARKMPCHAMLIDIHLTWRSHPAGEIIFRIFRTVIELITYYASFIPELHTIERQGLLVCLCLTDSCEWKGDPALNSK